MANSLLSVCK